MYGNGQEKGKYEDRQQNGYIPKIAIGIGASVSPGVYVTIRPGVTISISVCICTVNVGF